MELNMKGNIIGRWTVLESAAPYITPSTGSFRPRWVCKCECGKVKLVRESTLLNGQSKSCGCLAAEWAGDRLRTHGLSQTPLFGVWYGMVRRCTDSTRKDFKHYGGRGIEVCSRWESIHNFIEDMESTYQSGLEIERINVNGNYEPSNCTWVDRRTQVINRRPMGTCFDTRFIEYDGKTLCLSQWADETGVPYRVLIDRLGKLNWSYEKAFTTKVRPKRLFVNIDGTEYTLSQIFKAVPNIINQAVVRKLSLMQYVANMLYDKAVVVAEISSHRIDIEPTTDLSHMLSDDRLNDNFKFLVKYE